MIVINRSCSVVARVKPTLSTLASLKLASTSTSTFSPLLSNSKTAHAIEKRNIHTSVPQSKDDYYKTLGVNKSANAKDIKKAYFQLAKKYHPDVNKTTEAQEKFQAISEAYEVLSDDTKRQQYDTFGSNPAGGAGFGAQGGPGGGWSHHNVDVNEVFRKAFGFNMGGGGGMSWDFAESQFGHGHSEEVIMNISFEEAVKGAQKTVLINVVDDCLSCKGSQVQPGYKKVSCPYCNGSGMVSGRLQGGFIYQTACNRCMGSGHYNKNPCHECEGKGQTVQRKSVSFNIPPGTSDKNEIRINHGKTAIYVRFNVRPSTIFKREHDDIHCDVEISLAQAVLGGTVKIPSLSGDRYIHIDAGTSSHTLLKLTGQGVKRLKREGHGDQYIHIKLTVPKKITEAQRKLIFEWTDTDKPKSGTVQGYDEYKAALDSKDSFKKESAPASKTETSPPPPPPHTSTEDIFGGSSSKASPDISSPSSSDEKSSEEKSSDGFFSRMKKSLFGQ
ncbi:unnamed protein product [Auanema sp. JU1783]|nr:unnamed protein product [Auanema sp. JU1783]